MWRWDQADPFGNNAADENPSGLGVFSFPLRFEGAYLDRETNLRHNVHRYRDTDSGRFIQADPLGLKGGDLSLYVLTRNNPLSFKDPLGLTVWLCNRQVVWYLGGVGNHSYFWNDQNKQCCGRDQGHDPLGNCKERGPGGDACVPITGSQGKEDGIMKCCQQTANQGTFLPPKNDCHTSVDRCLKDVGLPNPGAPGGRMGSCSSCWLSDTPPPSIDYTAP